MPITVSNSRQKADFLWFGFIAFDFPSNQRALPTNTHLLERMYGLIITPASYPLFSSHGRSQKNVRQKSSFCGVHRRPVKLGLDPGHQGTL